MSFSINFARMSEFHHPNSLDDSSNYTLMKLGTILNVSLKIASRDFVEKSTNQLEGFLNVVDLTTFQQFKELVFDT